MENDRMESESLIKNKEKEVSINMEDFNNTEHDEKNLATDKENPAVLTSLSTSSSLNEDYFVDTDDEIIAFIIRRTVKRPKVPKITYVEGDTVEVTIEKYIKNITDEEKQFELRDKKCNLLHMISMFLYDSEEATETVVKYFSENGCLHKIDEDNAEALHIAAYYINSTVLKTLLKYVKPENRDRFTDGDTAYGCLLKGECSDGTSYITKYEAASSEYLEDHESTFGNLAIFGGHTKNHPDCFHCIMEGDMDFSKYEKYTDHHDFVQCLKLLLDHEVDANKVNFEEKSPIYIAAEHGYKHAVKLMLKNAKQKVDIITYHGDLKNPRKLIKDKNLYKLEDTKKFNYKYKMSLTDQLFQCIRLGDEELFQEIYDKSRDKISKIVNDDNQSYTLLQNACEKDLVNVIEKLLEAGADPNTTIPQNKNHPLWTAFKSNNHTVLKILVNGKNVQVPEKILHKSVYELCQQEQICKDSLKSVRIVLDSPNYNGINCKYDEEGYYTLLYYASHNEEIATLLLEHGAFLATVNDKGQTDYEIIKQMNIATLGNYFDFCIKKNSCSLDDKHVNTDYAEMNFSSVVPNDLEKSNKEMDVVKFISDSEKLSPLLAHPLISSFLFMKWHLLRWFFFINVLIFIGYNVSLYFYIFHKVQEGQEGSFIWEMVLLLFLVLLSVKEVLEIFTLGVEYFFSKNEAGKRSLAYLDLENVFEISLVILTYFVIFVVDTKYIDFGDEAVKIFYVFIVLLTSVALLFELEQLPFVNQKVAMLKKVASNIASTFNLFVIFFIPFALSFTILNQHRETDEPETNFFRSIFSSLFKTIVMMTGEYDMKESMDFKKYNIASILLFLLFVFCIAIICFNLLIGLAVSDTQEIVNDGERLSLRARTHHICYVQSLLDSYRWKEKFSFANRYGTKVIVDYFNSGKIIYDQNQTKNVCWNYFNDKINTVLDFFGINIFNFTELGDKIAEEIKIIIDECKREQIYLNEIEEEISERKESLHILRKFGLGKKNKL